jgi:hypothetical protein
MDPISEWLTNVQGRPEQRGDRYNQQMTEKCPREERNASTHKNSSSFRPWTGQWNGLGSIKVWSSFCSGFAFRYCRGCTNREVWTSLKILRLSQFFTKKTIQFDDFSYRIKWQRMLQAGGTLSLMYTVRCDELKLTLGNLFLCYLIGIFSRRSWKKR